MQPQSPLWGLVRPLIFRSPDQGESRLDGPLGVCIVLHIYPRATTDGTPSHQAPVLFFPRPPQQWESITKKNQNSSFPPGDPPVVFAIRAPSFCTRVTYARFTTFQASKYFSIQAVRHLFSPEERLDPGGLDTQCSKQFSLTLEIR